MAGSKQVSSCTCILIILIVSSHLAPACEARRLMAATSSTSNGEEACTSPAGCPGVHGSASLTASGKISTTDGRSTAPGHSPGIGNKLHAAGNDRR
ncbi:hypothetical protein ACUV84_038789 [Puccinellia chinampoensis]